jgi:hypothetical protein
MCDDLSGTASDLGSVDSLWLSAVLFWRGEKEVWERIFLLPLYRQTSQLFFRGLNERFDSAEDSLKEPVIGTFHLLLSGRVKYEDNPI